MSYLTLKNPSQSEYVEKRSKFLGVAFPCETEEEALSRLEEIKSRHHDARHNCFAFVVEEGRLSRFSDDGEPHGTAGKPILEVINGKGLVNVGVVVTRYFGGVLLGTGGLVRAYTAACKEALEKGETVEMVPCTRFSVVCDYTDHSRLVKLLENSGVAVANTEFTHKVTLLFDIKDQDIPEFSKSLTESFCGRLTMEKISQEVSPFPIAAVPSV